MDSNLLNLVYTAAGILIALVGSWAYGLLKTRPDYAEIEEMALRIVRAAEQMFKLDNEQKLTYAIHQLGEWLRSKGWNVSDDLIRMFIENAVKLLKPEFAEYE